MSSVKDSVKKFFSRSSKKPDEDPGNAFKSKIKNFSNITFSKLQNLSRVIVFPVAILPVAGLFLGLGGGISAAINNNLNNLSGNIQAWKDVASVLGIFKEAGQAVFTNLGLVFCIAVSFGFAKQRRGVAAFSGFIAFVVMTATIHGLFFPTAVTGQADTYKLGFDPWNLAGRDHILTPKIFNESGFFSNILGLKPTIDTSVFGGLLLGFLIAVVHNRFVNIRLPRVLSFFGGERFVPIVSVFTGFGLGVIVFFVWPALLIGFRATGRGLGTAMNIPSYVKSTPTSFGNPAWNPTALGFFAAGSLGALERLLIPTGLHHVLYTPFWFSSVGGRWDGPNGVVNGAYNVFFAQNSSDFKGHLSFLPGTVFMSGRFSFIMIGYPFACLAMYLHSSPANRKATGGIMLSAGLTSFLTGITEPILFSYLFVAPLCWGINILGGFIGFGTAYLFNIVVGQGFAAGAIDFSFFGILPSALGKQTGFYWVFVQGAFMALLYFFGFYYIIKWKDYPTLGRGDAVQNSILFSGVKASLTKGTKKSKPKGELLLEGLGLKDNILKTELVNNTINVEVKDTKAISKGLLRVSGTKSIKVDPEQNVVLIRYTENAHNMLAELKRYLQGELSHAQADETAPAAPAKKQKTSKKSQKAAQRDQFITMIHDGLGGVANIKTLSNCATRLRVTLLDISKYNKELIMQTKPAGIFEKGNSLQIIYGPEVTNIRNDFEAKYHI